MSGRSGTQNPGEAARPEDLAATLVDQASEVIADSAQVPYRLLSWINEVQQVQLRHLTQCCEEIQTAADAADQARDWAAIVDAQNELMSRLTLQALGAQRHQLATLLALQAEFSEAVNRRMGGLAWPAGMPDLPEGYDPLTLHDQVRESVDAWLRQWQLALNGQGARP